LAVLESGHKIDVIFAEIQLSETQGGLGQHQGHWAGGHAVWTGSVLPNAFARITLAST
jgi:hypothetical protein